MNELKDLKTWVEKDKDERIQKNKIRLLYSGLLTEKYPNKEIEVTASENDLQALVFEKSGKILIDKTYNFDDSLLKDIWSLYDELNPKSVSLAPDLIREKGVQIPIEKIKPSPLQIRTRFDTIQKFAKGLETVGQVQAIAVYEEDGKYILVHGERRLRAAKLLGWSTIRADIFKDKETAATAGLAENTHRDNINPIAYARHIIAIRDIIKQTNCWGNLKDIVPKEKWEMLDPDPFTSCTEIDEVIESVSGFSKSTQYNLVKSLKEEQEVQDALERGELDIMEGKVLLRVDRKDLPEEFQVALSEAQKRSRLLQKIGQKASDVSTDSTKFLLAIPPLEKMARKLKKKLETLDRSKIDEKTLKDTQERIKGFIEFLKEEFQLKDN